MHLSWYPSVPRARISYRVRAFANMVDTIVDELTQGCIIAVEKVQGLHYQKCSSCPYVFEISSTISKQVTLERKEVDDVLGGEDAWKNVQKAAAVCESCGNKEAYFREIQTRSADEPATLFFRCTKCAKVWKEG